VSVSSVSFTLSPSPPPLSLPHHATSHVNTQGAVLGIIFFGLIFSALFHLGTVEPCTRAQQRVEKQDGKRVAWFQWFLKPQLYMVAGIYMGTRLIVNVSQVYTPLYLVDTLSLPKESVAIGPLAIYASGFLTTLVLRLLNKFIGRYMTFFCGLALTWGALVWFWMQEAPAQTEHPQVEQITVYGSTVLLGAGGSTLLVTSLSMVADLIGPTVGSGAFVYGLMSFTDKVSNGVAVQVVQALHPCKSTNPNHVCCSACAKFYRIVLSAVPGGATLCALICLAILTLYIYRRTRQLRDVAPACAENGPCLSSSVHNKSLQSEGNSSLSATASMNTRYRDVEDETKPLIKRTPVKT
jgi:Na+/melibiose symporter-like transporter